MLLIIVPRRLLVGDIILLLPLFPYQCAVGLATGFSVASGKSKLSQRKPMKFVWILPTLWMMLHLAIWQRYDGLAQTRWQYYFWTAQTYRTRFQQLIVTLPFLSAVTYSLGHYIGRATYFHLRDLSESKQIHP
jgi:hypothetical protein